MVRGDGEVEFEELGGKSGKVYEGGCPEECAGLSCKLSSLYLGKHYLTMTKDGCLNVHGTSMTMN